MQTEASFKHLIQIFIGPRAQSYLKFIEQQGGQNSGLSWAGLIFGPYWLLYRKMYRYFFLFFAVGFLISMLALIIGVPHQVLMGLALIPNLILAGIGKRLYSDFAVQKTKAYMQQPKYSEQVFAEEGGVNWGLPLLLVFIQSVVMIMLSLPFIQFSPL
ncbi:DUF2628 domain-containing protein [Avibacterium paragallinarum]